MVRPWLFFRCINSDIGERCSILHTSRKVGLGLRIPHCSLRRWRTRRKPSGCSIGLDG